MAQTAKTAKERREMNTALKPIDSNIAFFHKDAGFVVTWRPDKGFGVVMMAQADSHTAALHAAKTVVALVKKTGMPLVQGGSSWALSPVAAQGMAMAVPSNVPLKIAPYISAKDDWLIFGSHPMWTTPSTATPTLQVPPEAAGSPTLALMSMQWLPSVLSMIEKQPGAADAETAPGLALVHGLHLETSQWAGWGHMDPTGRWSQSTGRVSNWDWRAALDNTVQAIQDWKPAPKGKDLTAPNSSPPPAPPI